MNYIKGHILVNSFYKTEKFMEHYHCLQNSAKRQGVELDIIENSDILCSYGNCGEEKVSRALDGDLFLLFWDKDIRLVRQVEKICHEKNIFWNESEDV